MGGGGCFLPRPTNMSLQNGGKGKITILSPITFHFLLFFTLLNIYSFTLLLLIILSTITFFLVSMNISLQHYCK